jgi:integrase/recombinase XerD
MDDARRWFVTWLRDTRDLSAHTLRAYNSDVNALMRFMRAETPLTMLNEAAILGFFEDQRSAGICSSSLRRRSSGLHAFCAFLERQGHLHKSPWPHDAFTFRKVRSLPRALSGIDLTRLTKHLILQTKVDDDRVSLTPLRRSDAFTTLLATSLLITTGVRVAELVAFEVTDVDIPNRTIRVMGKGRRERVVYLTNDRIAQLANEYLIIRQDMKVSHNRVFFNARRRPLSTSGVRQRLANAATAAGIQRRVTPHMLRHSAATQLIESGVDIRFVQRLLGHASLTTTEIYTHVTNKALRDAVMTADVLNVVITGSDQGGCTAN